MSGMDIHNIKEICHSLILFTRIGVICFKQAHKEVRSNFFQLMRNKPSLKLFLYTI